MDRDYVHLNQLPARPEPGERERGRAARRVASAATDARECALLLEALGLSPEEGIDTGREPRAS